MFFHLLLFAVNQLARLAEAAIMRFPLETDTDCFDAVGSADR